MATWKHDKVNLVQHTGNAWRGGQLWEHPCGWWIANAHEGFSVARWVDLPDEATAKRTVEEWLEGKRDAQPPGELPGRAR